VSFEEALDAWITSPRYSVAHIDAFCVNPRCRSLNDPVPVTAETEYGTTTWEPDGCPDCGAPLEEEPRPDLEEDDG